MGDVVAAVTADLLAIAVSAAGFVALYVLSWAIAWGGLLALVEIWEYWQRCRARAAAERECLAHALATIDRDRDIALARLSAAYQLALAEIRTSRRP